MNSPILDNHPQRMAWREYYKPYGFQFNRQMNSYVNGGFIGLTKEREEFLHTWVEIQELMGLKTGGLQSAAIARKKDDLCFMFKRNDQDALNVCLMNTNCAVSSIGKEGMDFNYGGYTMSHAVGKNKPWQKLYTKEAIFQKKATLAEKQYWKYTQNPIQLYSTRQFFVKKADLTTSQVLSKIFR